MNFKDYKDNPIPDSERRSCSEVLAAMDCLMHHLNDEDNIACWLRDGVQDNDHWRVSESDPDRAQFYYDLTEGMTYNDYETCVMIFAKTVMSQCFTRKYTPRAFT